MSDNCWNLGGQPERQTSVAWPTRRCPRLLVLGVALALLSGCGGQQPATETAADLAAQACTKQPGVDAPASGGSSSSPSTAFIPEGQIKALADDYAKHADLAARAAAVDPAWDRLATAYSRYADAWLELAQDVAAWGSDLAAWGWEQRQSAAKVLNDEAEDAATIRAMCRRTAPR